MKFGLGVNVNETISSTVKKSIEAERLGIDYVWVSDVPEQRYASTVASAIASNTKRIRIGLGLLSPFLHTPAQIASSFITLEEAYGERFELLMGPGDRNQLSRVGVSLSHPIGIQNYLSNAKNQIEKTFQKNKVKCKIWLGAQGPKMLETSRYFDGVLLNYAHPNLIKWAIDRIGFARKEDFQLGIYALSYVYADLDPKIFNLLRVSSAIVALGASEAVLKNLGLDAKVVKAKKRLDDGFSVESVIRDVPLKTVELFSIFKSSIKLEKYLSRMSKMKIDHVVFGYPQNYSEQTVRDLADALKSYRKHEGFLS